MPEIELKAEAMTAVYLAFGLQDEPTVKRLSAFRHFVSVTIKIDHASDKPFRGMELLNSILEWVGTDLDGKSIIKADDRESPDWAFRIAEEPTIAGLALAMISELIPARFTEGDYGAVVSKVMIRDTQGRIVESELA